MRNVALNAVAAAALFLSASMASGMGLGRLSVQSALGESLRAEIDVSSLSAEEAANLQVRVASPDAYRSAGVDYNPVLPSTQTVLMRRPDGRPYLRLSSDRPVQEPFVDVILEISWSTGRLVREYTLLFDPPARQPATGLATLPSTAPAFSAAPQTAAPAVAAASTPQQLRAEAAAALAERRAEAASAAAERRAEAASAAADRRAAAVSARASAAAATAAATPAPAPAVETPAPSRQAAVRPAPRPAPEAVPAPPPVVVTTRPAPPATSTVPDASQRTAGAGAGGASSTDTYEVQRGDTLSRIATRTQRPGVSLDQMLVSLYRSNGDAFIDNNMNRLKTGSVLAVPSTEAVKAIAPGEARQVIQAQSADFQSYRQRLAGVVPTARGTENARRASGQVQAAVDDRKQSATTTPDRLRLSKSASAAEERIAQENASRDSATRVAELSKNVEQLRRLSGETAASAAATASAAGARGTAASGATAPAAASPALPASSALPAVVVAPPAVSPAASTPGVTAAASNAAVAAATAAALAASTPSGPASQVATAPADAAAPVTPAAPVAGASSAAPVPVSPTALPDDERSVMDTLLDNPLFLPAVGVLALLLLAAIAFRLRARAKEDSGETSFLESRLQPDSFFGASGGQRIDTRESNGGAASSSMSYSLSQLDAIGDVDPVAEADVYLAYGRDLQAEEILKEAMRSTPDRLAIRTKLLEVYAKRRDTKGYEVLATALFSLTDGMGEDWAKAQEMGAQIDPENPLYQPGGRPEGLQSTDSGHMIEPLGASTMPQSILPGAATVFQPTRSLESQSGVDLDLDLGMAADSLFGAPTAAENTQPFNHDQYRETSSAPTSRFGADAAAPSSRFGAETGAPSRPGTEGSVAPASRFDVEPSGSTSSRFGADTGGNSMNFELPSDFPATYGGKTAAGAAAAGAAAMGASTGSPASRAVPLSMEDTAPAAFSNPSSFGQGGNGLDSKPLEFDLSDISLDLDAPMDKQEPLGADRGRHEIPDASLDAMDLGMDMDLDADMDSEGDPLERKYELAEEFRQIGDVEGARDLLREVVGKADGTLKTRAQGLLDSLS